METKSNLKSRLLLKAFHKFLKKTLLRYFHLCTKFTIFHTFLDFKIYQVDIITIYLQKELNNKIYIKVLEEVKKLDSGNHY